MHGPGAREFDITVAEVPGLGGARAWYHKACGRRGAATVWGPGPEAVRWARRHHRCPLAPRAWVDCNEEGRAHDWAGELRALDRTYWKCRRCPVSTMTLNPGAPPLPAWTKGVEYVYQFAEPAATLAPRPAGNLFGRAAA